MAAADTVPFTASAVLLVAKPFVDSDALEVARSVTFNAIVVSNLPP